MEKLTLQTAPNHSTEWDGVERRYQNDRRRYSFRSLSHCIAQPRRARERRKSLRKYPMLDTFDGSSMALAVLLTVFSILDALFTLTIIGHGGSELNPIMDYFLQRGINSFMLAKLILTAIPAVLLVALGNALLFGRFRARSVLSALVGLYAGLLVYELGLLSLT